MKLAGKVESSGRETWSFHKKPVFQFWIENNNFLYGN